MQVQMSPRLPGESIDDVLKREYAQVFAERGQTRVDHRSPVEHLTHIIRRADSIRATHVVNGHEVTLQDQELVDVGLNTAFNNADRTMGFAVLRQAVALKLQ